MRRNSAGAVIVEPTWGEIVAGPLYGEKGMLVPDCDLRLGLHAKCLFDAVGHYSRDDALGIGRAPAAPPAAPPAARDGSPPANAEAT